MGPFELGLRRWDEQEKSRWYFRSINTLWNLNNVATLRRAPSFEMRCGLNGLPLILRALPIDGKMMLEVSDGEDEKAVQCGV
jgi:hypothetical protein